MSKAENVNGIMIYSYESMKKTYGCMRLTRNQLNYGYADPGARPLPQSLQRVDIPGTDGGESKA